MELFFSQPNQQRDEKDNLPMCPISTSLKDKIKENMQHAHNYIHNAIVFTRLSSLFATMEAKRLSPANSEMRKMYSGAVTWLDRWVRPEKKRRRWWWDKKIDHLKRINNLKQICDIE